MVVPVPVQVTQQGEYHLGALHIESARGFIEEEEPGLVEERHCKDEPLFHPLGVCLHLLVFPFEESQYPEEISCTFRCPVTQKPGSLP